MDAAPDHLDHAPTRPNRFVNDWRTKVGGFGTVVALLISAMVNTSGAKEAAESAQAAVAALVPRVTQVEVKQEHWEIAAATHESRLASTREELRALEKRFEALERDLYSIRIRMGEDRQRTKRHR